MKFEILLIAKIESQKSYIYARLRISETLPSSPLQTHKQPGISLDAIRFNFFLIVMKERICFDHFVIEHTFDIVMCIRVLFLEISLKLAQFVLDQLFTVHHRMGRRIGNRYRYLDVSEEWSASKEE